LFPQLTGWPQLSFTVPHMRVPHGFGEGVQPQVFDVHAPASQVPQSIGLPQLSVVGSQRPLHHIGSVVQSHWFVDGLQDQPLPLGHVFGQFHDVPHASVPEPQCVVQ
jgi:hypothetical protein